MNICRHVFWCSTAECGMARWLQSYQDLDNIEFALHRMSQRSPRMADLTTTFKVIESDYTELEEKFSSLYRDVLRQSYDFQQQLNDSTQ